MLSVMKTSVLRLSLADRALAIDHFRSTPTRPKIDTAPIRRRNHRRAMRASLNPLRHGHPIAANMALLVENYPIFGTAQSRKRTPKETSHTS
jgi:hypothetical protein